MRIFREELFKIGLFVYTIILIALNNVLVDSTRIPRGTGSTSNPREYCSLDTFSPQCGNTEIIVMQHAMYGRMKIGTCMKTDYGLENCLQNSLSYFDRLCSGKSSCDVFVPVPALSRKLNCLGELKPYLEAGYTCQKVTLPSRSDCSGKGPLTLPVTSRSRRLASATSARTSCGLHESPYVLEAKPGQTIVITLTDFYWEETKGNPRCNKKYGYILDITNDDVINICGGGSQRKSTLYTSQGHQVQILLGSESVQKFNYLIEYQAVGCPEVTVPPHAWIKRQNNSVTVGCLSSTHTWQLKCAGNMWIGYVGNCTRVTTPEPAVDPDKITDTPDDNMLLPYISNNHLLAFGMICLTIIICCSTVALGCYCTKRYELSFRKSNIRREMYDYNISQVSTTTTADTTTAQRMNYKPVTTLIPKHPYVAAQASPALPARNNTAYSGPLTSNSIDMTTGNEEEDDSVKYYVLENPNELSDNERKQLYTAMHLVNGKP